MKEKFYISTAIDYPSTAPHLGHAYEKICADVIARFKRLQGFEVHFSTGTDEHGLKIQKAAENSRMHPQKFVDLMSEKFRKMCDELNISYDDFIRTTEDRHAKVVRAVIEKLQKSGDIYKGVYEGPYCTECETFYSENELEDGKCPIHHKKVDYISEEGYFFRMGKYKEKLLDHIRKNPDFIRPESSRKEILSRLEGPLRDLCITRKGLKWAIPFPSDEKFGLYVWVDALSNYLTTIGYPGEKFRKFWPADVHVIGKDIVWHHFVIWGSMLLSMGLPLPRRILVHGFVTVEGRKLSKSLGLVIDPLKLAEKYSPDALRYFAVRSISFGQDGDFSEEALQARLNTELADVLGNFVHRVITFINRSFNANVPNGRIDERLEAEIVERVERAEKLLEEFRLTQALEEIFRIAQRGNEYLQAGAPWKAVKTDPGKAADCLFNCANLVKILCVVFYPFIPSTCEKIAKLMNLEIKSWEQAKKFDLEPGHAVKKPEIPFRKARVEKKENMGPISIEDFEKLDLRIGEILRAEGIPGSKKLLKLQVDLGGETRTLVAGIARDYPPAELIGKRVVVVANLEPAKIMGVESRGMVLAADDGKKISLLVPDKPVESGSKVR